MGATFVGRQEELGRLVDLYEKPGANLVVVKGRRRVGKSALIDHFANMCSQTHGIKCWRFSGLAPEEGVDAQGQRDHFAKQLANIVQMPTFTFLDWSDAFSHLSQYMKPGDIIVFDEISWMGSKDATFIPKLKTWWDDQHIRVLFFMCGSVSTWIEENILKSTAFFGRINLTLTLMPFSIPESVMLLRARGFQGSDYDTFRLLSILEGIPWYLEQVVPGQTADAIIKRLCFEPEGLFVLEFDRIFHDLFNGSGKSYKKILDVLSEGPKTLAEIRKAIDFPHSGTLSQYVSHLIVAGFIQKQALWSIKTKKEAKQSLYYICDPYMRFYLKVIEPQRNRIQRGSFKEVVISQLPGFDAHMGFQLGQLLLQNRHVLWKVIGVNPMDIVADGPFRQSKTSDQAGCQIDYLVQKVTNNVFVCEFKFKRKELGVDVIAQVQHKVNALKVPRGFASISVLFHIGGVSSALATDGYFYRIIDLSELII